MKADIAQPWFAADSGAGVCFVAGSAGRDGVHAVRIQGSAIAAVNELPRRGDLVVDLHGDRLLPGLINAHDHLGLNSMPATAATRSYRHVREWIAATSERRRTERHFQLCVGVERAHRLFHGGVKNLLSGVTTVAHHDPLYPELLQPQFPIRVLEHYGWAHSLYLDGTAAVRNSYVATRETDPWIIHVAEGVSRDAAQEFDTLDALGCIGPRTLLVHGVALEQAQRKRLLEAGAGLIWCPSSNEYLFGRTAEVDELAACGRVALGTDSRLSGARDLLEELQIARRCCTVQQDELEQLVTTAAAQLLRLKDCGVLRRGYRADLLVLPSGTALAQTRRSAIRLVLSAGVPMYADEEYAAQLASRAYWSRIRLDGSAKLLPTGVVAALVRSSLTEPGLELPMSDGRAA